MFIGVELRANMFYSSFIVLKKVFNVVIQSK